MSQVERSRAAIGSGAERRMSLGTAPSHQALMEEERA